MPGSEDPPTAGDRTLLFFDGECGMCDRFVGFVLRRERNGTMRFAALQGETAAASVSEEDRESLRTLVLETPDGQYRYSSAVVRVLWRLGAFWRVIGTLLWLIPRPLRDAGYRVIAARRKRGLGDGATCRVLSEEDRARFLP